MYDFKVNPSTIEVKQEYQVTPKMVNIFLLNLCVIILKFLAVTMKYFYSLFRFRILLSVKLLSTCLHFEPEGVIEMKVVEVYRT